MKMVSQSARAALMVGDSAKTLKRFYFLQRECVLAQAGWMPGTLHWETKLLWPEFLWQDALTATELRERVLELRYPERRVEPGEDAALIDAWRELLRCAPSDAAFAAAIGLAVKPFLQRAYSRYLEMADVLDDAPTVRILRQALVDLDEQRTRLEAARSDGAAVYAAPALGEAERWAEGARRSLEAIEADRLIAGDAVLAVPPGGSAFAVARRGRRYPRFSPALFPWPNSYDPSWRPADGFDTQLLAAVQHVNEVWAAEMAAAVLFDLADDGPPEFLKDGARWCFDEIRHCRMGYARLGEWGFRKAEIPLGSFAYDAGAELSPIDRLGIIFYFETTYIHTKPERARAFAEFGDRTSSHDMDFDWADELIHTYYGKKWLGYFAERHSPQLSLAEIKESGEAAVARIRAEASEEDRRRVQEVYQATQKRARELAAGAGAVGA